MTPSRILRAAIVLITLVTIGTSPAARTDEPRSPVLVPVVVTDPRGGSITNLGASDVEVTEKGERRKIASLQFHGPAPRTITILLDDYHVSPGEPSERTRSAVGSFIDDHLGPDDTLTVVRPPDHFAAAPTGLLEAREAVRRFAGRKGEYATQGAFEAEYMSTGPASASRQRAQIVRAALESAATAMRQTDGAKALIVVTEGFAQGEPSRARMTTLRAIGRAARIANIPVYILDPSTVRPVDSPLNEAWRTIAVQTGGMLFDAGSDLRSSLARIAADLNARYVVAFEPSGTADGSFHAIEVRVTRKGAIVRAPTGYWAPFGASRFASPVTRRATHMLTPHASGLIQPWFRMAPGSAGRTRVTFAWTPRPAPATRGRAAARVALEATTFEGVKLHASSVAPLLSAGADARVEATFEAPPGPVQISMAIATDSTDVLDTDVRYLDVPRLDRARPVISAIEFVRPRSLPEFTAMQNDPHVMPTEVRDFLRQDRLLVRVRAFAASGSPEVLVRLMNRMGQTLLVLPSRPGVGDAAQFELPFARYPRGEYRLEVTVIAGAERVTQLLTVRVIG
jgi:VWFA-related protein